MKYLLLISFIIFGLMQCKKADTIQETPPAANIFDTVINSDNLVDTVTLGQLSNIDYGYFLSYDNLNRVKAIKFYEYFYNKPVNNERTCTFSYSGNNILPTSVNVFWVSNYSSTVENFQIYFFYNQNKTKNRDSIVDLNNLSQKAIRKYTYDSTFRYAKATYYKNADTIPAFEDSATFNNYNCNLIRSDKIDIIGAQKLTSGRYYSTLINEANTRNPFSGINIFPAFFMSNYLFPGNLTDGTLTGENLIIDFTSINNLQRLDRYDWTLVSAINRFTRTSLAKHFDTKNRLIENLYVDSSRNAYADQESVKYHYRY